MSVAKNDFFLCLSDRWHVTAVVIMTQRNSSVQMMSILGDTFSYSKVAGVVFVGLILTYHTLLQETAVHFEVSSFLKSKL